MRRWRKMTWIIWIWCVAIIVWAVAGGSSAAKSCHGQYQSACQAGTGIGIALILVIGFIGFVFLSLIWLMTRPKGRTCPVCGENVKRGRTACPKCGHDFAAAAAAGHPATT